MVRPKVLAPLFRAYFDEFTRTNGDAGRMKAPERAPKEGQKKISSLARNSWGGRRAPYPVIHGCGAACRLRSSLFPVRLSLLPRSPPWSVASPRRSDVCLSRLDVCSEGTVLSLPIIFRCGHPRSCFMMPLARSPPPALASRPGDGHLNKKVDLIRPDELTPYGVEFDTSPLN